MPLMVAIIYFGTFLTIGYFAKKLLDGLMDRHGATLDDVQEQAGLKRGPREVFLLGAWRTKRD